jgi:integrase
MPRVWITRITKRGKREYVARWLKPDGSTQQENLGTGVQREANRRADKIEERLAAEVGTVPWETVKKRYRAEKLAGLKDSGLGKWRSATNALESFADPASLFELDTDLLSRFGAHLRESNLATDTIRGYLAELSRTLVWASKIWRKYSVPDFFKPKKYGSKAKGRPITTEEFERLLDATKGVVGAEFAASWKHVLRGLWLSGLRLSEVHQLRWDRGAFAVRRIETDHPRLHIAAGEDKGGRAERLPMWHFPDLVEFLRETPGRHGFVFDPQLERGRASQQSLGKRLSEIGKAAGVVVARVPATDKETGEEYQKTKFASAHTLRASFGTRWAAKGIERELLRRWMRHRHYLTTDQYYVDIDPDSFDREAERETLEKEA